MPKSNLLDLSELTFLERILKYAPPCPTHGGLTGIDPVTRWVACRHCLTVVQRDVPRPVEI